MAGAGGGDAVAGRVGRGRLVGPRSVYARTLEVAYPLRALFPSPPTPLPRSGGEGSPESLPACRVVIPEPTFWDPETPFLYEVRVELWEDGQLVDRAEAVHGLRTRGLTPGGLRWNGRPITLRGVTRAALTPEDAAALRQAGCNTLVAPAHAAALWDAADRLGFLVLGRVADSGEPSPALRSHACVLGWLLPPGAPAEAALPDAFVLETPVEEAVPRELVLRRPAP